MVTLVELCAGSAAVSLAWLSAKAKPPLGYQGSKRAFAEPILRAMGLAPGGATPADQIVLVEPGPWGEAWKLWTCPHGRQSTIERLRVWSSEDPRELWTRFAKASSPEGIEDRVATWATLSFWGYGRKAITVRDGKWKTHGFSAGMAYYETYQVERNYAKKDWGRNRRLPDVVAALEALPYMSNVSVFTGKAQDFDLNTHTHTHNLGRSSTSIRTTRERSATGTASRGRKCSPLPKSIDSKAVSWQSPKQSRCLLTGRASSSCLRHEDAGVTTSRSKRKSG